MTGDPFVALLEQLDRPVPPRVRFADELLDALERELAAPRPRFRPLRSHRRALLVAAVVVLVLAALASAALLRGHARPAPVRPSGASLTILHNSSNGPASIFAVAPGGKLTRLWRCADDVFCGELVGISWSPDGRHLAFSLTEVGAHSGYVGLHILDLASGKDHHVGGWAHAVMTRPLTDAEMTRGAERSIRVFGCPVPSDVTWSPDSRLLAYTCERGGGVYPSSRLYVIRPDGTRRREVPTGVPGAYWPTWSPDGHRIAFATAPRPLMPWTGDSNDPHPALHSAVYVVNLDGSGRTLLARDATAPSWSPTTDVIAFWSACRGVGLVSSEARILTPGAEPGACAVIGRPGPASWSPDGTQIAISSRKGLFVMGSDGHGLTRLSGETGRGLFDTGRATWTPEHVQTGAVGTTTAGGVSPS